MALQAIGLGFESPYLHAAPRRAFPAERQARLEMNIKRAPERISLRASSGRRIFDTGARAS